MCDKRKTRDTRIEKGDHMRSFTPFDARNTLFKDPFGAVAEGENIHFSVNMPRSMGCTGVTLILTEDGGEEWYYQLFWRSTDNVTEWWECDVKPEKAGLYWYYFEYSIPWGTGRINRSEAGRGSFSGSEDDWQLTVYSRDFKTPDWLPGGVIYQIFPDRFFRSGQKKENVPADRVLRDDIAALPEWRPDEKGIIRNNDYFQGDLAGITEKLPYLASLGVTCIYLNPIFEAHSNHRYDTADYMKIDPLLGTESDARTLCERAAEYGIRVIFDGVFSHTGADSIYFNKYGRYGAGGAYNDPDSPYRKWYKFGETRDEYDAWWGIDTLPEVNEKEPSYLEFITGNGGVVDKWLSLGFSGVRLDVADELPDEFLDRVRTAVKRCGDKYLLGEVWEDATNKISWGARRRYLLGGQLDSVMNYPFREAIVTFLLNADSAGFMNSILEIVENYPSPALNTAMNHLGTHDTARILTVLSGEQIKGLDRERQSKIALTAEKRALAKRRLRAAAGLQYTLPGVPSLYYGDEAGLEGASDPFNRRFFPWDDADAELTACFAELGRMRAKYDVFREGRFIPLSDMLACAAFLRKDGDKAVVVISNMNAHEIDYTVYYPHADLIPVVDCEKTENGDLRVPGVATAVAEVIF